MKKTGIEIKLNSGAILKQTAPFSTLDETELKKLAS